MLATLTSVSSSPSSSPSPSSSMSFVHPGVFISPTQLAYIKSSALGGTEPFAGAYAKALGSKYAQLDYVIQGPPASGIIECGSYSKPDFGCSAESSDSATAYLQSLLFFINGTQTYADNSVAILRAYAANLKGYNNSNAPLQSAWAMGMFTRAAELLLHTPNSGYTAQDAAAFSNMLYATTVHLIYPGSPANGNWELSMIEAMLGLAVLSENSTLFQHAVTMHGQRVPAYLYVEEEDGPQPVPAPRGFPGWYNQSVFNSSVDGICQETCRDEGHTQMGIAASLNGAETALIQGVDLFTPHVTRFADGLEFLARLLLKYPVPAYVCNGTVNLSYDPTGEVGYNALVNRMSPPQSLPLWLAHLMTQVRTMPDPASGIIFVYETLTHGGSPPPGWVPPPEASSWFA
jgi:hypothetical protein